MHKIMVRTAAAVAALALLGAGCNPFARVQDRISERVGEEIGERLLEGSVGAGTDLELGKIPANFPKDVPQYPGGKIVSAVVTGEGKIAIMNFQTEDSPEEVVAWYEQQLLAAGFTIDASVSLGTIKFYTKDDVRITVQAGQTNANQLTSVSIQRVLKD